MMKQSANFLHNLGVFFADFKARSRHQAIQKLTLPSDFSIAADWAEPLCAVGDYVLKGQCIADGKVAAHAPTSGHISHIVETATGFCIQLKADGLDEQIALNPISDYSAHSAQSLIRAIHQAGIVGMGGAGFPLAEKLLSAQDKPIHTLLINGAECEPFTSADEALMQAHATTIIDGVLILQHISQAAHCIIAIEEGKTEALAAMQKAISAYPALRCEPLTARYPSGHEQQLIEQLCGIHLPPNALPADYGVLSHNVASCYAVAEAILKGQPLISRVITVSGAAIDAPQNVEVLIGTPIQFLLTQAQWREQHTKRLSAGGPLTGTVIHDTKQGISKTHISIIANTEAELGNAEEEACIRCGFCVPACPVGLLPQQLLAFSKSHNEAALSRHQLNNCIECAACEVVCPSHIPLVDYFSASKARLKEAETEQQKARWAEARFNRHQQRKALQDAEREAKRLARTAVLKEQTTPVTETLNPEPERVIAQSPVLPETSVDPVAAALARAREKREPQAATITPQSAPQQINDEASVLRLRIETLTAKLGSAEGAAKAVIEKTINTMQQQLAQLKGDETASIKESLPADADDPVAAALARARAKRPAPATTVQAFAAVQLDEKAQLQKRIDTLQAKLNSAEGPARDVIANTLNSMQLQLQALQIPEDGA